MWEYGVFKLTKMYLPDVYSSSVRVLEYTWSHLFARLCVGILPLDVIEIIKESQWLISVSSKTCMPSVYIGKGKERGQGMSDSPPVFS